MVKVYFWIESRRSAQKQLATHLDGWIYFINKTGRDITGSPGSQKHPSALSGHQSNGEPRAPISTYAAEISLVQGPGSQQGHPTSATGHCLCSYSVTSPGLKESFPPSSTHSLHRMTKEGERRLPICATLNMPITGIFKLHSQDQF